MNELLSPFVTSSFPYWTALLAGFFGGVHCMGMCGGVLGALSFGLPASVRENRWKVVPYMVAYNGGRILTYAIAGGIVGYVGALGGTFLEHYSAWTYLRSIAAVFMILFGLYISGWWMGLQKVEAWGGRLWTHIQPLGKRLLPVRSHKAAFSLGLLWGWLPCGLVYSLLIWAFAAGGWQEGALFMLAFGVGTLPTLMTAGVLASDINRWVQDRRVRYIAGGTVIFFGLWTLAGTLVHQPNVGLGCVPPG